MVSIFFLFFSLHPFPCAFLSQACSTQRITVPQTQRQHLSTGGWWFCGGLASPGTSAEGWHAGDSGTVEALLSRESSCCALGYSTTETGLQMWNVHLHCIWRADNDCQNYLLGNAMCVLGFYPSHAKCCKMAWFLKYFLSVSQFSELMGQFCQKLCDVLASHQGCFLPRVLCCLESTLSSLWSCTG